MPQVLIDIVFRKGEPLKTYTTTAMEVQYEKTSQKKLEAVLRVHSRLSWEVSKDH
jgi:hypothetical protein